MKIVVFGNNSGFGGAQTAFRQLVKFLVTEGHSVGVIALANGKEGTTGFSQTAFQAKIEDNGLHICKLAQVIRASLVARRFSPEIFITVGLAQSAALIARLLPQKTFCICQDFIYGRSVSDPLLKASAPVFDALAVQAPSMVAPLRSQGFEALALSWLPCFPDPPLSEFRRTERNGRSEIRLAYFGRLAPNKGIELLLPALASARLCASVKLDIWGSGSELECLRKLSSDHKLDAIVSFRGRYPEGAEYARLLCSYDGLVMTSTGGEGLPLILLEAMAYGVPFLTTTVGAIPDCGADNEDALLVAPSLEALRAGLEQFVARAASNAFSTSRLQSYYENHFGFKVMADRWRDVINAPKRFFLTHA